MRSGNRGESMGVFIKFSTHGPRRRDNVTLTPLEFNDFRDVFNAEWSLGAGGWGWNFALLIIKKSYRSEWNLYIKIRGGQKVFK